MMPYESGIKRLLDENNSYFTISAAVLARLDRARAASVTVWMRVALIVLPQQVLTVIVAVRRPYYGVNVFACRFTSFQVPQRDW
jgi:hypothetical protein